MLQKIKSNNIIFLLFFSSLFLYYIWLNKIYYVFYGISLIGLLIDFLKQLKSRNTNIKFNKVTILLIIFMLYTTLVNIFNIKEIGFKPLIELISIYVVLALLFVKLNNYKIYYNVDFYKKCLVLLNISAIIGSVEIFEKRNLFSRFLLNGINNWQTELFGTIDYRISSIFAHPIVYGLFLVVLFWCNKFIIIQKYKFILQLNVLINLYFTQSRSAWISFAFTLFLYYLKSLAKKFKTKNFQLTYKKILLCISLAIILTIVFWIFSDQILKIFDKIFQRFITATSDEYNDISRLQRLGSIEIVKDYMFNNGITNLLFGNGFKSVADFMRNNTVIMSNFSTTDNQYLSIFYEFGIIGISLYCIILFSTILKFFKNSTNYINDLNILCFLSISVVMFFFESFGWTNVFIFLMITLLFSNIEYKNNEITNVKNKTKTYDCSI